MAWSASGPRSELAARVASGLVMAGAAIGVAFAGGWSFALFWTTAAVVAMREWLVLIGVEGTPRNVAWSLAGVGIAAGGALAETGQGALAVPFAATLIGGLLAAVALGKGVSRGWVASGALYCGLIAVVPIGLRSDPMHGLTAVLWIFAVVWATDIAAYFTGRRLGGPKLWPRISPKKTWSGFFGGVAGGLIASWVVVTASTSVTGRVWVSGVGLFVLSLSASLVSVAGDLFESSVKRRFGVKDSGHMIPGHGGVLDRLDSFVAVCALLLAASVTGLLGAALR